MILPFELDNIFIDISYKPLLKPSSKFSPGRERMSKRKNGENGQYNDKDPKDLPMIKSGYGKGKKGDK